MGVTQTQGIWEQRLEEGKDPCEGLEGSLTYTTDALITDFWLPLSENCAIWCHRGVLPAGREGASQEVRQAWSLSFSNVAISACIFWGAVLVLQSTGEEEHCLSSSFLTSGYSFVYRAIPKQNPKPKPVHKFGDEQANILGRVCTWYQCV